jgi:hypothetical protein
MNIRKTTLFASLLCAWTLASAQALQAAEDLKGSWTIMPSKQAGHVRLGLIHRDEHHNSNHESDWPASALQGLDAAASGKRDVQFTIAREAGRFTCEGYMNGGEGAGIFHLALDSKYSDSMRALGFTGIDEDKQFVMAVYDVTTEFARQMKAEKLTGLDTEKLIAFRIFDVTPEFISELRAEGVPATDSDKVVAFRIHGVTAQMVRDVKKSGITASEDQLIAMRIHGVTPEFIQKVEKLGFKDPTLDQLVAMRIHGVTPEFIADMKTRGLPNLSIDKLVSLRIHGID